MAGKTKIQQPRGKLRTESCVGKEYYLSLDHSDTYEYTYADNVADNDQCLTPTYDQRAAAVLQAQSALQGFAEVYCKSGGYGDDQCDHPCECRSAISQYSSKIKGWRKSGARCFIEVEISAHIDCKCK